MPMSFSLTQMILISAAYLAVLFGVAWISERGMIPRAIIRHPLTYTLSLGVYASAWAFYGTVGLAYQYGYGFLSSYLGVSGAFLLAKDQSLTLDFNGYRTKLDNSYVRENNVTGDDNKIWSLAATFATGPHSFTLAHQRSTGDSNLGYAYGGYQRGQNRVGDGGNTIYLANSYWSDFNAEDERSWQLGYGLDFTTFGVPGLTYNVAYVRGDNITTSTSEGGTEREIFNQFKYVVQGGPAKDLSVRLRSSVLRVSQKSSEYNVSGNELRVFVDYPINVF